MAEETGQRLFEAGWRQGAVFGPLSHMVHFRLSEPVKVPQNVVEEARASASASTVDGPPIGQAIMPAKPKDQWLLATQDCDLVKGTTVEPYVVAIRCFTTSNDRIISAAATNSSYYFLIDPDQGLVADARIQIQLEKPALWELTPSDPFIENETRQRFARWLARRADRPAIPETIVEHFVAPVLDLLNRLRSTNPTLLDCLNDVVEIRFSSIGESPIQTAIVFLVKKGYPLDGGVALAELVGLISEELDQAACRLIGWEAISYDQVSVEDYVSMDQLYLDSYTFQGQTRVGLGPSPRL